MLPRYFLSFDLEIGVQTQVNSAVHPHLFEKLSGGDRVKIFNLKVYIYTHKGIFQKNFGFIPLWNMCSIETFVKMAFIACIFELSFSIITEDRIAETSISVLDLQALYCRLIKMLSVFMCNIDHFLY